MDRREHRIARASVATLAIVLAALAGAPAASGDDLSSQTLSNAAQVITWHGQSSDPTGQGYGPPTEQTCTSATCDTLLLDVRLPSGTFTKGPLDATPAGITRVQTTGAADMPGDGVLIAVKWATDFDQWNLYVDDMSTSQTVASGIDLDSNSQSVLLSRPHNGLYRIRIVPFYTDFDKRDLAYQGEATVFRDPSQRYPPTTRLLPQIETVAPSNFHIGDVPPVASNPTGWRFTPDGTFSNSCYLDELLQFGSTRCLRFDNTIRNVGDGPLVLRFNYSPDAFDGNCQMLQELVSSNGSLADRAAGPCVFHAQHGHFHYQNMGRYQLFAVDANGRPAATPIAASNKVGFCTVDVDNYTFGGPVSAQHPRSYSFPTCNIPNGYSTQLPTSTPYGPGGVPEFMGISAGWGDIYTWDLPQQYIDISNVPNGTYEVVSRSNPDAGILTSDRSLETGITCIRIGGLTGNQVTVLHELPSQPNAAPLPPCYGSHVAANAPARRISRVAHRKHRHHGRRARHRAKHAHRKPARTRSGGRHSRRHAPGSGASLRR